MGAADCDNREVWLIGCARLDDAKWLHGAYFSQKTESGGGATRTSEDCDLQFDLLGQLKLGR